MSELGTGAIPEGAYPAPPGSLFVSRAPVGLWQKATGTGAVGWELVGGGGPSAEIELAADFNAAITAPVYSTLLTLQLTTISASSDLFFAATASWRHTGAFAGNAAFNLRIRVDGVLVVGGATDNKTRAQIGTVARIGRVPVVAGLHTVLVEVSKFGAVGNTIVIDPVTSPDLAHAAIFLQEQAA